MKFEPACSGTLLLTAMGLGTLALTGGCHVDSFFNPSVTGYWEPQPTTIPILTRIDAIESDDDGWGQTTGASPEDLVPSDLTYRLSPGDFVTVRVLDLFAIGAFATIQGRVDPGGQLRVPEIGDVPAAGLTLQELQDSLREAYLEVINTPQVDVSLDSGTGFTYSVYGFINNPNVYQLTDPDWRLLQAAAIAGGVADVVERIFVIRRVELSEAVRPTFDRRQPGRMRTPDPSVDIEDLIDQLDERRPVRPGFFRDDAPSVDIDELETAGGGRRPVEGIDQMQRSRRMVDGTGSGAWVYIEERGEWVRMPGPSADGTTPDSVAPSGEPPMYVERIIEIPARRLFKGDSRYNIVIRPGDQIYIEPPMQGLVYIDGQINRPGVFEIPIRSDLTLSRLVATAGGLGQIAIPDRIDLVRRVGPNREAVIRVNLAAIRHRTEPDILIKPDDHIIVGTSFAATPLAVIRNGFRATYGFGFLLDRNFGNDVFGAPPLNRVGQ